MKRMINRATGLLMLLGAGMFSCTKDTKDLWQGSPPDSPPSVTNRPPVAEAGMDRTITYPTDTILLDGSFSTDPDGNIAAYLWKQYTGNMVAKIDDPNASKTVVRGLLPGEYRFELTVTDRAGAAAKDYITILVTGPFECDISSFPQVKATFTEIGTLSIAQTPYVTVCGSKILFAGGAHGYDGVDIYDVNDMSWTRTKLSVGRTNMAVVSCGNKVFFAGGNSNDMFYDVVDIYDIQTGQWSVRHLSEPTSFAGAAAIGDMVFFAGGITEEGWNQTDKIEVYDISEDLWSIEHLSEAKTGVTGLTVGNKVYFAGGLNYLTGFKTTLPGLQKVDIYDASTHSWSSTTLHDISGDVSGIVHNGLIYWSGLTPSGKDSKIEIWEPGTGQYSTRCLSYPRGHPASALIGDEIVFFPIGSTGAMSQNTDLSNHFDIYNTATGAQSIGLLDRQLAGAAVVSVGNNIYVAGGRTAGGFSNKVYQLTW